MASEEGATASAARRRLPRRVARCVLVFVPGLFAAGAAFALGAPTNGTLLVWGIDGNGWHFLAVATAFLLLCAAICWTAVEIARAAPRAWRTATGYIVVCVVASGVLLIAWPAAIIGFLSFGTEYRTVGTISGHDLVVRNAVGLGDSSLDAGVRNGAFVEFNSTTGDTLVRDLSHPLSEWSFTVHERNGQAMIRYTSSPGGPSRTLHMTQPQ